MYKIILSSLLFTLILQAESTVHIDVTQLRCLICRVAIDELNTLVKKIDPDRKIDVGGYRIDSTGNNLKEKIISEAKSEVHLSELADTVCDKIDDYVRATWKDTGKLTLLKLTTDEGLNPDISSVDIIQDDDLNKSLKYYCDGIMNDYEDSIIDHFKNESDDVAFEVCNREANYCKEFDQDRPRSEEL